MNYMIVCVIKTSHWLWYFKLNRRFMKKMWNRNAVKTSNYTGYYFAKGLSFILKAQPATLFFTYGKRKFNALDWVTLINFSFYCCGPSHTYVHCAVYTKRVKVLLQFRLWHWWFWQWNFKFYWGERINCSWNFKWDWQSANRRERHRLRENWRMK